MTAHFIFYFFAAMAVGSAIGVVTARHPVRSVLSLVLTFFAMSGVWMILQAEFLSLILLLVYVGAVMTLFLFVVMMLRVEQEALHTGFVRYLPIGLILIAVFLGLLFTSIQSATFEMAHTPSLLTADASNLKSLGRLLFTDYVYPFEIAGVILLAAMVAAITLAFRGPMKRNQQQVEKQIAADPKNYVRLVKMQSDSGELK